jgi:hypothetical protein
VQSGSSSPQGREIARCVGAYQVTVLLRSEKCANHTRCTRWCYRDGQVAFHPVKVDYCLFIQYKGTLSAFKAVPQTPSPQLAFDIHRAPSHQPPSHQSTIINLPPSALPSSPQWRTSSAKHPSSARLYHKFRERDCSSIQKNAAALSSHYSISRLNARPT